MGEVKITDEQREVLMPLAKQFAQAYISYQMGIAFKSAERYIDTDEEIGELWYVVADFVFASVQNRKAE